MSSRSKLIDAAITLFSERGYFGTSIREISERAGTNISSISFYFGGKSGLLAEILKTIDNERLFQAKRLLSSCDTKVEFQVRLESFLHELASLFAQKLPLVKVFLHSLEINHKSEFSASYFEMLDELNSFILIAQKKGFVPKSPDSFTVLIQIVGPLVALVLQRNSTHKHFDISIEDRSFQEELVKGLVSRICLSKPEADQSV